jgi:hypothetical protein
MGTEAARYFAFFVWATFLMFPFGLATFVTIFLEAKWPDAITRTLVGISVAAAIGNLGVIWLAPVMSRRAASKALGIKVIPGNAPPNDEEQYKAWCAKNHLQPFSAEKL